MDVMAISLDIKVYIFIATLSFLIILVSQHSLQLLGKRLGIENMYESKELHSVAVGVNLCICDE